MPIYDYECSTCGAQDKRVAAFDDQFATCHLCGGLMIRTNSDPLSVELWDEKVNPCATS